MPWSRTPQQQALVVEDEPSMRLLLRHLLELEGFAVLEASSAADALRLAGDHAIGLYTVDLGLPDEDGMALIRQLRGWTQKPLLVVSGRALERHKVQALDAGADDYLTKPFGAQELRARVRALVRRSLAVPAGHDVRQVGTLSLNLKTRAASRAGEHVHLTATEWRLLDALLLRAGEVVPAELLLQSAWGPDGVGKTHHLRVYISRLRRHIEAEPARPAHLLTEVGAGYRLLVSEAATARQRQAAQKPSTPRP